MAELFGFAALAAGSVLLPHFATYFATRPGWIRAMRARVHGATYIGEAGVIMQQHGNDCGAACLKMMLAACGIQRSLADLTLDLETTPKGTSMLKLRLVAARSGLQARSRIIRKIDPVPFPAIAFVNRNHFVVIRRFVSPEILEVDDPALGKLLWPVRSFRKAWRGQALVPFGAWDPPPAF